MCRINYPAMFKGKRYLVEYAQLRVLWASHAAKLTQWCEESRINPETCFVHRPDGERATDENGLYIANLGCMDYREWTAHAINQHFTGEFFHPTPYPRPVSAVMVDVPLYYESFDPMTCRITETTEYANDVPRYIEDAKACTKVLQNRITIPRGDILPNLSHVAYIKTGQPDEVMAGVNGCLFEWAVNVGGDSWRMELAEIADFCKRWPDKKKFLILKWGTFERAAMCATYLDSVCANVWIAHNTSQHTNAHRDPAPIWEWNYNPLLT